jgi:O-acetyl-ADP-ribose deacetylase (regulator of RNase III)
VSEIAYVTGDATRPIGDGPKIIAHVCNDEGKWGAGFVLAVSLRWPQAKRRYLDWHSRCGWEGRPLPLGEAQFVAVDHDDAGNPQWVANVIGQRGIETGGRSRNDPPIRYEALRDGLDKVAEFARDTDASVHMPRIGCGLAGGTWKMVGPIVERTLCERGVRVVVYDWSSSP